MVERWISVVETRSYQARYPTFLLTLFAKNEKDNLSMAERNQLAAFAEELKKHFKR